MRHLALLIAAALACGGEVRPNPQVKPTGPSLAAPARAGLVEIPADSPMLAQIRVEAVTEEDLPVDEVVAPAKLEIAANRRSLVLLPVAGRVLEVKVRAGDRVNAGDTLLVLDSPEADVAISEFKQAEAAVTAANASLVKARSDLERARGLFAHDAVARKEVDNTEAAHTAARSELVRAQAERQRAHRRLKLLGLDGKKRAEGETIAVRAPMSGKVLEVKVAAGEYRGDTAEPLITIADLSELIVAANVAENLIRFIDLGEPVTIDLVAFPGEEFSATVIRIADLVAPTTRTIEVHAALPNPAGRFRPEMFGRVRHGHGTTRAPALPLSAVLQRADDNLVLIEHGPGQFELRAVKVSGRAGGKVAIMDGVAIGERVVVDGGVLLLPPE